MPASATAWTTRSWCAFSPAMAMCAAARCASRAISRCAAASSICGRPARTNRYRLDFFGSTLDAVRRFDAETQLSTDQISEIELLPASEVPLDKDTISRFRSGYVAQFGPASDDPLYEAISEGRPHPGMQHWLPLFYAQLETLFDYVGRPLVMLSHQAEEAKRARLELIADYYETRRQFLHREA